MITFAGIKSYDERKPDGIQYWVHLAHRMELDYGDQNIPNGFILMAPCKRNEGSIDRPYMTDVKDNTTSVNFFSDEKVTCPQCLEFMTKNGVT